ncbi:LPS assembly lipoprotein LptE [Roseovarius sp. D22-M7]|uniref:LPS assembly lipoprotein LptE n=1 Tax=Roseovarius sp. D22-M7 TaxID=3127116 RepID=UPI00301011DC
MSSSDRRLFLLTGLAVLAGCGFSPAYGPGGGGTALRGQVEIAEPDSRAGYILTRDLESRLGRTASGRYALTPEISLGTEAVAIDRRNVAGRFNILGSVRYTLTDRQTGETVTRGTVDAFSAYSARGTPVATRAARRDAEARLMTILADQMVTRLLATAPEPR